MKTKLLTFVMAVAFTTIAQADCTLTTDCDTRTYQVDSISVNNDGKTITVKDGTGNVIDSFSCEGSSVSSSCSSGPGGDYDFCDTLPDFLKPFFGC